MTVPKTPPKISAKLERYLDPPTLERGRGLVRLERIQIDKVAEGLVQAKVQDGRVLDVYLRLKGTDFSFGCKCKKAAGGGLCEHVFAVVRAAEEMGAPGFGRRLLTQSGQAAPSKPSRVAQRSSASSTSIKKPARGDDGDFETGRVPRIELSVSARRDATVEVALVQHWRRADGALISRSAGWQGLNEARFGVVVTSVTTALLELPEETVRADADAGRLGARRDRLLAGEARTVPLDRQRSLVARLAQSSLLVWKDGDADALLQWNDTPWTVELRLTRADGTKGSAGGWEVSPSLIGPGDAGERHEVARLSALIPGGVALVGRRLVPIQPAELVPSLDAWRRDESWIVSDDEVRAFLAAEWARPNPPQFDLPDDLRPGEQAGKPRGRWTVTSKGMRASGRLAFIYGAAVVSRDDRRDVVLDGEAWVRWTRDGAAESSLDAQLERTLDTEEVDADGRFDLDRLAALTTRLEKAGFEVWWSQRRVRASQGTRVQVSSGVEWFDVDAQFRFGDVGVGLPELLRALESRDSDAEPASLLLADGSLALIPEDALRPLGSLASFGAEEGDAYRFAAGQAGWADQLVASAEAQGAESVLDETFRRARMQAATPPGPVDPPSAFVGTLRPYQQEGLGWLSHLAQRGFGGILADDMGLGKTVQVLAHVLARRKEASTPSLVIAPRSVVHQWAREAERFTPTLSVLVHGGPGRARDARAFEGLDLVVMTYGIVRRDIEWCSVIPWDLVVLDEAQAVKNAQTVTAKAVRRLDAGQRLVVTGTPVENHLGELASHLTFLDPALGAERRLDGWSKGLDAESLKAISRAVRPLLLRRTKDQVAGDLPERIEQDLLCEMDETQSRRYGELQEHFARTLAPRVRDEGVGRQRMQVLEALLRLRQAACHPGLLDASLANEPSAKFDVLLPRLDELIDEGAKALVFSQFTKHLDLLGAALDQRGHRFVRLDGSTRDRQAVVDQFQDDDDVRVFLISLKAGGVGLNLTAASYVFLLDPWWNPAAEAQAIDRAHRRGQTRRVIAYRLLARGTVEEKIRALQESKQALSDAVLAGDAEPLRALTAEDLEVLLGAG